MGRFVPVPSSEKEGMGVRICAFLYWSFWGVSCRQVRIWEGLSSLILSLLLFVGLLHCFGKMCILLFLSFFLSFFRSCLPLCLCLCLCLCLSLSLNPGCKPNCGIVDWCLHTQLWQVDAHNFAVGVRRPCTNERRFLAGGQNKACHSQSAGRCRPFCKLATAVYEIQGP